MIPEDLRAKIEKAHENSVLSALSVQIESLGEEETTVSIRVDDRHRQVEGVVHGGVYVLLAETAASIGAACLVDIEKYAVYGMEINANHLRPVRSGIVRAIASAVHKGKQTMVFSVRVLNQDEELVCISRCTIAVRKRKA